MCYFHNWHFPLAWVRENCLASSAQRSGTAELIPVMDSNLSDDHYRLIFDHIRRDFPQVKTLAWFQYGQWTEEMLAHIKPVIR